MIDNIFFCLLSLLIFIFLKFFEYFFKFSIEFLPLLSKIYSREFPLLFSKLIFFKLFSTSIGKIVSNIKLFLIVKSISFLIIALLLLNAVSELFFISFSKPMIISLYIYD